MMNEKSDDISDDDSSEGGALIKIDFNPLKSFSKEDLSTLLHTAKHGLAIY